MKKPIITKSEGYVLTWVYSLKNRELEVTGTFDGETVYEWGYPFVVGNSFAGNVAFWGPQAIMECKHQHKVGKEIKEDLTAKQS